MANRGSKDELMDFLMDRAFNPILNASAERYGSDSEREKLKEVQDATRREVERFRERDSISGIVDEFKGDLSSEPAEKVQRKLHALDLPALPDIEDDFRKKVEELGHDY
jgi:hypothetical protein